MKDLRYWPEPPLTSHATAIVVGAVSAAAAAGLVGGVWLSPSDEELRRAALELVPNSAADVQVGENTGSPVVVGQYFVRVEFESPDSMDTVHQDMLAAGAAHGWQVESTAEEAGGTVTRLSKDSIAAQTTAYLHDPAGAIQVRTDGGALALRVIALVVAAALIGGGLGYVLNRRTQPSTIA